MYRHQQQATASTGGPPQFHHPASSAASWYSPPAGYQPSHHHQVPPPPLQQYPNCVQEEQQSASPWHHHHHHVFQPEWPPDFGNGPGMLPAAAVLEDPQLPSPPITVSSSELSSPGAVAGSLTPPQQGVRPARSPYEWMKKPSYQSQSNPGESNMILLVRFLRPALICVSRGDSEENHDSRRHVYVVENILNWEGPGSNPSRKA